MPELSKNPRNPLVWLGSGAPWIWISGAAVAVSVIAVAGLILLLAANGLVHFWPAEVFKAEYQDPGNGQRTLVLGEVVESRLVSRQQLQASGLNDLKGTEALLQRVLVKTGNRDRNAPDFRWFLDSYFGPQSLPVDVTVFERREWGDFYGFIESVSNQTGHLVELNVHGDDELWRVLQQSIERSRQLYADIEQLERGEMHSINYGLEQIRLQRNRIALSESQDPQLGAALDREQQQLEQRFQRAQQQLRSLYSDVLRDAVTLRTVTGEAVTLPMATIVRAYRPNAMDLGQKLSYSVDKALEFLGDNPREANTEGGIFPAIFGTVTMVILMSIFVAPFGVVAAIYLREYAPQGKRTQFIRIAVNNLAGVPSIVYGVFGLGFFIYAIGGSIDELFYREALPAPTFGTPGLLWASLTLALLTLPVVIVATEEGLSRIPSSVREGSLALGATQAETLRRVVLPIASPAMMTGLILAVARAAGEVAPLMLVGVVKLAPSLPIDGNFPYLHLDQKFMHLGFHIYDVGFQSPNVEAARPLVYATALLLVIVIALLNFSAVAVRNHLREKYKGLEV